MCIVHMASGYLSVTKSTGISTTCGKAFLFVTKMQKWLAGKYCSRSCGLVNARRIHYPTSGSLGEHSA